MASTPLLIGLTVRISSVATANLNVTCRNEATDQSKAQNTSSDGKTIFNLGSTKDFSKGWNVGDKVSVVSIYQSNEQKFSFTIPASGVTVSIKDASASDVGSFIGGTGMTNGFLDLVSAPSIPSLRYFTAQEFLDFYNLKTKEVDAENGIEILQLTRIGQQIENEIDALTNTKFDDNDGSFYSSSIMEGGVSPELHDVRHANQQDYFMKFIPISSVTTFQKNNNAEGATTDFETLTAANNDIAIDTVTGRIRIIDSGEIPAIGAGHVKVTYLFGRATTPQDIKELAIMMTGRRMVQAAFIRSRILKLDDPEGGDVLDFTNFRDRILKKYKNQTLLAV